MKSTHQFKAHIVLTFEEQPPPRRRVFGFDESGHRRVPMSMEGVDGLHTVCLQIGRAGQFTEGQEFDSECCVIWTEGFFNVIKAGVKFKLWDGGFFANGIVTEKVEEGWAIKPK